MSNFHGEASRLHTTLVQRHTHTLFLSSTRRFARSPLPTAIASWFAACSSGVKSGQKARTIPLFTLLSPSGVCSSSCCCCGPSFGPISCCPATSSMSQEDDGFVAVTSDRSFEFLPVEGGRTRSFCSGGSLFSSRFCVLLWLLLLLLLPEVTRAWFGRREVLARSSLSQRVPLMIDVRCRF